MSSSLRLSELEAKATKRPSWLTDCWDPDEKTPTGAGSGARSDEVPLRISVLSAGSGAAPAWALQTPIAVRASSRSRAGRFIGRR